MSRLVLAIDTSTPAVTAGVVADGELLAERVTVDARAHAERITPNVLAAIADAGRSMADLDAVVVGCGPGPFTGLRVGMATAAAYGHALGLPVYGVCSLDAIGGQTTGEVLVVTDARRREVYWARYRDGVRIDGPAVNAPADVDPGPAQSVAGSPDHAALFGLPCIEPLYPDRRAWWPRWPTGRSRPRPWCRCICGGRMPRRWPSGRRRPSERDHRRADRSRRRPLRRAGGSAVSRRRPLADSRFRARARRRPQSLRGRTRCRHVDRLRRHFTVGPHAAFRIRNPHHRRRPGVPGPRHRPADAGRAAEHRRGRSRASGGPHRQRAGDRAVSQRGIHRSGPAPAVLPDQRRRCVHHAAGGAAQ